MVFKCCVPECKGNYPNGPKVQVFAFPIEEALKQKWIRAICRKDFVPTKYSKVCELHFPKESIEGSTGAYDSKTGKFLSVTLKRSKLKINAVPSILPSCPAYLSSTSATTREGPDERNLRVENKALMISIAQSMKSKEEYDRRTKFNSLDKLSACLKEENIPSIWSVIIRNDKILFLLIDTTDVPIIKSSLVVSESLHISAFLGDMSLNKLGKFNFPQNVNDMNVILEILSLLSDKVDSNATEVLPSIVTSIVKQLNTLIENVNDDQKIIIQFLIEQINSILCSKFLLRYSPEMLIFYCILHSISPHSYNFLRNSGYVMIPHPRTLKKICASLNTNPQLEQSDENFLTYITRQINSLESCDKTVVLLIDEIHIKPYLDYKGGNILGMAFNSENAATSAQVFMIQSLLSPFKSVVHIAPVKTINADILNGLLKKILIKLHDIGFKVIGVVSDNNSLNSKAMSLFLTPPKVSIVYPHPSDSTSPLFYIFDSVHILKCIRNNWINQKNINQCFYYPDFNDHEKFPLLEANFGTLKALQEVESNSLVKFSYGLTLKSLTPSNLERQNVKLVLKIFNNFVVQALLQLGQEHNLISYKPTANFITLICKWWKIVNVKTPLKGQRLQDPLQEPMTLSPDDAKVEYLNDFLSWLDAWKDKKCSTGTLTKETHLAISHTTYALLEMSKYCIKELNFTYFLPGKIQTDSLEDRFGKYRTLAGSQYLISITQIYESEAKLRMQNFLPLVLNSNTYGEVEIKNTDPENNCSEIVGNVGYSQFVLDISEKDFDLKPLLPVLTYLSGYCARSAISKLNCDACSKSLVLDKTLHLISDYILIRNLDRGGLLCPSPDVVTAVTYCYIVVQKLVNKKNEHLFLRQNNQRELVITISIDMINKHEFFFNDENCSNGHSTDHILKLILRPATNALLNNYCTLKNDIPKAVSLAKQRKLETVKNSPTNATLLPISEKKSLLQTDQNKKPKSKKTCKSQTNTKI